jgi:replication factor A1
LVTARETGTADCQNLHIEYRGSVDKEAIFLIKEEQNVVVQFRIPEETLQQKNISFDKWMDTEKIRKQIAKQNPSGPVFTFIQDLRSGMKKVNVRAEVLETQKPRQVHTQFGNAVMMAYALIADETGTIKLLLWNEQVNLVNTGDEVEIKNASVSIFKGEKQLRLGKTGTLVVVNADCPRKKQSDADTNRNIVCA